MLNDLTPFFKPLLMINDKSKKVNIFSFNLFIFFGKKIVLYSIKQFKCLI